jgi:hypothetical protein
LFLAAGDWLAALFEPAVEVALLGGIDMKTSEKERFLVVHGSGDDQKHHGDVHCTSDKYLIWAFIV